MHLISRRWSYLYHECSSSHRCHSMPSSLSTIANTKNEVGICSKSSCRLTRWISCDTSVSRVVAGQLLYVLKSSQRRKMSLPPICVSLSAWLQHLTQILVAPDLKQALSIEYKVRLLHITFAYNWWLSNTRHNIPIRILKIVYSPAPISLSNNRLY